MSYDDVNSGSLKVFVLQKAKQPVGCALQLYIIDVTSKAVEAAAAGGRRQHHTTIYSALHINSPSARFIKLDVALALLNIKFSSMAHLEQLSPNFHLPIQKSQGYYIFRFDFLNHKIAEFSNFNNFVRSEYFFLKFFMQRAHINVVRP